jgi:hypothetical protein
MTGCIQCGTTEPAVLRQRSKLHLLENNHIVGRANGAETVPMCLNCHARYTVMQVSEGVRLDWFPERNSVEWVADCARQVAYLLRVLADCIERWAEILTCSASGLDRELPLWRDVPELIVRPGERTG